MRSITVLSILVAASCSHRAPLQEGPVARVVPRAGSQVAARSQPVPAGKTVLAPRASQTPIELIRAARRAADRVLGSGVAVARRDEVALLSAKLIAALARVDAADRRDVRRLFRRLPRLARELIPPLSVRPGAEEAALLRALELGPSAEVLPKLLRGLRLGMTRAELQASRPDAYRRGSRSGRWWTLPVPAPGPYSDARCRFTRNLLKECRVKLRLTRIWPSLGAKVIAKWGRPKGQRRSGWRWRLADARVSMRQSRFGRDRQVELRIRRRWSSRWSSWRSGGSRQSRSRGFSTSHLSVGRRLGSSRSQRGLGSLSSPSASRRYFATGSRRSLSYFALGTGARSRRLGKSTRIRRSGTRRYEIPRRVFSEMFARPLALQREVRLVPHEVAGVFQGLWLYDLRLGSRLRRLGLRNGDLVTHIGETRLSSPAKVLEALAGLRHQRRFTVAIERTGRPRELSYRVRY